MYVCTLTDKKLIRQSERNFCPYKEMMYIELEFKQRQLLVTLFFRRKLEGLAASAAWDKSLNCVFCLLLNSV